MPTLISTMISNLRLEDETAAVIYIPHDLTPLKWLLLTWRRLILSYNIFLKPDQLVHFEVTWQNMFYSESKSVKNPENHTHLWFAYFNQTPTLRKLSCWTSSCWRKSRSWAILLLMSGNGKEYQLHYSISHFWDLKGDANNWKISDFYKCHLIRIIITDDEVS